MRCVFGRRLPVPVSGPLSMFYGLASEVKLLKLFESTAFSSAILYARLGATESSALPHGKCCEYSLQDAVSQSTLQTELALQVTVLTRNPAN